jgi:hypothetical protein
LERLVPRVRLGGQHGRYGLLGLHRLHGLVPGVRLGGRWLHSFWLGCLSLLAIERRITLLLEETGRRHGKGRHGGRGLLCGDRRGKLGLGRLGRLGRLDGLERLHEFGGLCRRYRLNGHRRLLGLHGLQRLFGRTGLNLLRC